MHFINLFLYKEISRNIEISSLVILMYNRIRIRVLLTLLDLYKVITLFMILSAKIFSGDEFRDFLEAGKQSLVVSLETLIVITVTYRQPFHRFFSLFDLVHKCMPF